MTPDEKRIVEWLDYMDSCRTGNDNFFGHVAWCIRQGDHRKASASFEQWKVERDHRKDKL